MATKEDWTLWRQERVSFRERDSEGFTKDLNALEWHIKKLMDVCPKDEAGWPASRALKVINALQIDHHRLKAYLNQLG